MQIIPTRIQGLMELILPKSDDDRGSFIKSFHLPSLQEHGLEFALKESYFSYSHKDVIRGMHFQLPPHDHEKIVFCLQGEILDVVVDLRKNSSTYGSFVSAELSESNHKALLIPKGCAHGFLSLEDKSITYYLVSSAYHKESDTGILYNSFGMNWPVNNPVISGRDLSFEALKDFKSPF